MRAGCDDHGPVSCDEALGTVPDGIREVIETHVNKWTKSSRGRAVRHELISAGLEGYQRALASYEPSKGSLRSYSSKFIKGAIIREGAALLFPDLPLDDFLKRPWIRLAFDELTQEGVPPTVAAIANRTGLPAAQVARVLSWSHPASIEGSPTQDDTRPHRLEPTASEDTELAALRSLLAGHADEILAEANLDYMELFIFTDVLGFPMGEEDRLSYERVGRRLGMSGESVRKHFQKAKRKVVEVIALRNQEVAQSIGFPGPLRDRPGST